MAFFKLSVHKSRGPGPAFKTPKKKKKKKKILRQQPKQKSAFKLKTTRKPRTFSHHAAKHKHKPKSKLLPKLKHKLVLKSKPVCKPKTKAYSQHQPPSPYRPRLKRQNVSPSGPPHPKSKTNVKTKSRTMSSQYHNMSQPGTALPKSDPTPELRLQSSQPVWDTSVQAAIRVGDWKLLTGDPGHGDWVPPQVNI